MNFRFLLRLGLAVGCVAAQGLASNITVGSDGSGPLQLFASDGTPIGNIGPNDGTSGAPDGSGGFFVAEPGDTSSVIDDFDSSQNLLSSFLFTAPGDSNPDAAYIVDMTWGTAGSLWLTTFDGDVYNLSGTGQVLTSFNTGVTSPGIAFDGTDLYTDSGPGFQYPSGVSPFIYQMDTSGNILNTLNTGLSDTLGLSISASGIWVGGFDVLSLVSLDGTLLNQLAIPGVHFGVEDAGPFSVAAASEPSTPLFLLIGIGGIALSKIPFRKFPRGILGILAAALLLPVGALHAAISISSVTPSILSPQPVGTSITFTTTASDTDPGPLRYQYSVRPSAGGAFSLISDFSPSNTIVWTPANNDGAFEVQVVVLNRSTQSTQSQSVFYTISPRTSGGVPVVTATGHPLVALYSAPACAAGSTMRVRFKLASDIAWQSTPLKNCTGSTTMNFYVAGMRAASQYQMRQDVISGPRIVSGPILTFTTGSLPRGLSTPTALVAPQAPSSLTEPITLFTGLSYQKYIPFAVDAGMNVVWYASSANDVFMSNVVPGGGYTVTYGYTTDLANSGFKQYDVAGNLVKETTVERMNDQLAAMSMNPVTVFHHELRPLANGNYVLLAQTERLNTPQGAGVDVAGDMILVLDQNLQLLWAWDSFDHLDVSRAAVLKETCLNGLAACVLLKASVANDWLHGNSVRLTPDGNLLYSARHQDFVYKIDYQNGAGDGHVIWKLGKGGDFTWNSTDPWPWFSHQHDANYVTANTIALFDDGNTRRAAEGPINSRGQGLILDETNMTVNFAINVDVQRYCSALGSAQRLLNGNYLFDCGLIAVNPGLTWASEWATSGTMVSNISVNALTYRVFRLSSLFTAPY